MKHSSREPLYHVFNASRARGIQVVSWKDVLPGDVVVAPKSMWQKLSDYNEKFSPVVIVQNNPLLVLSRIDAPESPSRRKGESTFIVFSITKGLLISTLDTN